MPFNLPTREELKLSVKSNIQGILLGSNPFFPNGFLNGIATAQALVLFDLNQQLKEAIREVFWDTADGEFLERAASFFEITPLEATRALGTIVVQGIGGTSIPISQTLSVSGINYTSQASAQINPPVIISVLSIERSGSTASVTTVGAHNQSTGLFTEIIGANEVEYNGTFSITVTGSDTFDYTISGTPSTPATGTITASFTSLISITSLNRGGTIVTAETSAPHNQATGVSVTIGGADQTEYNGPFIITVTTTTRFTYVIASEPLTPATGIIQAAFLTAAMPVLADLDSIGSQGNQDSGTFLTFTSPPIAGLESIAYVNLDGLTQGNDSEAQEDFRLRFLQRVQNPVANFNVAAITNQVLSVPGNTRVFVQEVHPELGQVTIYFTRDNDDVIPTPTDVSTTKAAILLIKPANTSDDNVIVAAPTPKVVDYIFSSIVPNTSTMQTAVINALSVFYEEDTTMSIGAQTIKKVAYDAAVFGAQDLETGDKLTDFDITQPPSDISVAPGELGVLGNVTFA